MLLFAGKSNVPAVPQKFSIEETTETSIKLKWEKAETDCWTPVQKYYLKMYPEIIGGSVLTMPLSATSTKYRMTDLDNHEKYTFELTAENIVGCSDYTQFCTGMLLATVFVHEYLGCISKALDLHVYGLNALFSGPI